jgi:hypothetical protein
MQIHERLAELDSISTELLQLKNDVENYQSTDNRLAVVALVVFPVVLFIAAIIYYT